MKLLTEQQYADHYAASIRGTVEGAAVSGGVGLGVSYYMNRSWPAYRRLPISMKALALVCIVVPCASVQGERRGVEYDRSQWESDTLRVLDERQLQDQKRWDSLSLKDKIGEWANRNQYSIIVGGWAASLGLAGAIISRNKYQTYAQKIVQARMWAQGLTIGLLIVAGALTHTKREEFAKPEQHDHSWADILEQQERDRKEAERLRIRATQPAETHA